MGTCFMCGGETVERDTDFYCNTCEAVDIFTQKTINKDKIFIIGCSARKRDMVGPAKEVYHGPLWQSYRKYGEGFKCFVLSAKYGLIPCEQEIENYNTMLGRDVDKETMYNIVKDQVHILPEGDIVVAASKDYASILTMCGIDFEFVEGGIGYKRQKLNKIMLGLT